ncbi:MAG: phosphotransferase [bacterium]
MESTIHKILEDLGYKGSKITLLAGDASTRKYYRIEHSGKHFILMKGDPFVDNDPNVLSLNAYMGMGIRVPEIYKTLPEKGIVIQEDIGDQHLQNITNKQELGKYYEEVVSILVKFQRKAFEYERNKTDIYPLRIKFTHEKFMSELNMTSEFYISGYKNIQLTGPKTKKIQEVYQGLVDRMMEQPFLLQHRDYHSRNLMVHNGLIYVIDLQDSRLGPFTYDVASLIIDPYISLDDELCEKIIRSYYTGISDIVNCSYDEYLTYYDLCFLQRGIKILGTFAYQKIKKDNASYLKYIPGSLEKIKKVLRAFPEWNNIISEEIL